MGAASRWTPSPVDRAWARVLGPDAAWVPIPGGVAFTHGPRAVVALADGTWHGWPAEAHGRLRARVRVSREPTAVDRAAAQVCARGIGRVEPGPGDPGGEALDLTPWVAASRELHATRSVVRAPDRVDGLPDPALAELLESLGRPDVDRDVLRFADRPVAALLVDGDGRVRASARNTNGRNRTRHAEVNLLERWEAEGHARIPAGWWVAVGVQCCRMCAALLAEVWEGRPDVRFAQNEPGRFGRATVLQALEAERSLR